MIDKLKMLPILAYMAMTNFVQDLKKDERGLSGIVVAILLILVAVLAVVMIWGFMSGWLGQIWSQITGEVSKIK